jgi:translation elongation factor EF-G
VIIANAPLETLLGYSTALRSLTQGEATFAQAFAHLAPRIG